MSNLTRAIADRLPGDKELGALKEELRQAPSLTFPLLCRLPDNFFGCRTGTSLTKLIEECREGLTDPEWVLIGMHSGKTLPRSSGDVPDRVFGTPDIWALPMRLASLVFGRNSEMTREDFQAVLSLDWTEVLPMFDAHMQASDSLGAPAGDFFDWYCALAGASDYRRERIEPVADIILKILHLVKTIGAGGMLSRNQIGALARNVADVSSLRGLRAIHVEFLRAVRTRDVTLLRLLAQEPVRGECASAVQGKEEETA